MRDGPIASLETADGDLEEAALLARSREIIRALPDARLGIAPHSLRAVTPDALRYVTETYRNNPIHIHAAEQLREVDDCLAWSGRRPVEWLLEQAAADSRWCFVHATHMTPGPLTTAFKISGVGVWHGGAQDAMYRPVGSIMRLRMMRPSSFIGGLDPAVGPLGAE